MLLNKLFFYICIMEGFRYIMVRLFRNEAGVFTDKSELSRRSGISVPVITKYVDRGRGWHIVGDIYITRGGYWKSNRANNYNGNINNLK